VNRRLRYPALALGGLLAVAVMPFASVSASENPMVGGHAMSAQRTIVANAVNSDDNKTLVAAVKAAGLVDVLESKGPFTVFAPTDEAFAALPAGRLDTLLKPENKGQLTTILEYHVVAGRYDFHTLASSIYRAGGSLSLKTVAGERLIAKMNGPRNIVLVDSKGRVAHISTYDVYQKNGVINVIDRVLLP